VLHADDTTVQVLAPGQGRTRTGRLWAVVRDERAFAGAAAPAAFYRYSPDRRAEHAEALLGSCRGFLHADGYAGFNALFADAIRPLAMTRKNYLFAGSDSGGARAAAMYMTSRRFPQTAFKGD
jgi:hypothetical protein